MTADGSVPQSRLEDLVRGVRVRGIAGPDEVVVDSVTWHGSNAVTGRDAHHHCQRGDPEDGQPRIRVGNKGD